MATDTTSPARPASDGRCPTCRAVVRADTPWCTLCWTDLRPAAPEPEAAPVPVVGRHAASDSTLPDPQQLPAAEAGGHNTHPPAGGGGVGGWPCSACGAVNAVELDACAACGLGFLAGLRAEEAPLLELPGVGDITALTRAQRLGLAAGVVLVVLLLTALVGLLAG